jgi:hypothetical protein
VIRAVAAHCEKVLNTDSAFWPSVARNFTKSRRSGRVKERFKRWKSMPELSTLIVQVVFPIEAQSLISRFTVTLCSVRVGTFSQATTNATANTSDRVRINAQRELC